MWVTNYNGNTVSRIDPRTNRVVARIAVGSEPGGLAAGAGAVWVANDLDASVMRIDPATNGVTNTIRHVGQDPRELAFGLGSVWVSSVNDQLVSRIDPRSRRVDMHVHVDGEPQSLHEAGGRMWVSLYDRGTVQPVFPKEPPLQPVPVGDGANGMAISEGLWVVGETNGNLVEIDPAKGWIMGVGHVPADARIPISLDDSIWVAEFSLGTVVQFRIRSPG